MGPFEFIITLLSFVYSLALAQLLFGVARMVRHRRSLKLSLAHAIWMVNTGLLLIMNWITLWDFRGQKTLTLATIATAIGFAVLLYLVSAFVTPDLEQTEDHDLTAFHQRESPVYIGAMLLGAIASIAINAGAGGLGVANWASQNALLLGTLPLLILAFIFRRGWLHIALALANTGPIVAFLVIYYPRLSA
jgi:hypothetical protein